MSKDSQSIRRREFLRSAACAAGAMAAPWIVPASALGREAGKKAPSERIGVALIGLGVMSGSIKFVPRTDALKGGVNLNEPAGGDWGHYAGFTKNPDSHVVALCDVNRKRVEIGESLYERYTGQKGVACHYDFREVLQRDDVDAVCVATPDHWHAPITVAACRHGKDVYCEKGLALSIADGRAMVDAVDRYGRVFQYGSQSRSLPKLWAICKLVREGLLGEVKEVLGDLQSAPHPCDLPPMPASEHIDWDMWLGPAPWRPYHPLLAHFHWRYNRDYGGGMLDGPSHNLDILQCALGKDRQGPVEATPAPTGRQEGEVPVKGTVRYSDGTVIRNTSDGQRVDVPEDVVPRFPDGVGLPLRFTGTEGTAWFRALSEEWHVEPEPLRKEFETRIAQEAAQARYTHQQAISGHHGNFLHSVRTRNQPVTDVLSAHHSITLAHLLCIAEWTGRTIRWDPDNERIVGDQEASRLLGVPKREPWRV